MRRGFVIGTKVPALAIALLCAFGAFAQAEPAAPPAPAPPAPVAAPPPAPAPAQPTRNIVLPAEKTADLQTHWNARRDYLRDRDERRADDEEGRVRQLKDDLALENLFSVGG